MQIALNGKEIDASVRSFLDMQRVNESSASNGLSLGSFVAGRDIFLPPVNVNGLQPKQLSMSLALANGRRKNRGVRRLMPSDLYMLPSPSSFFFFILIKLRFWNNWHYIKRRIEASRELSSPLMKTLDTILFAIFPLSLFLSENSFLKVCSHHIASNTRSWANSKIYVIYDSYKE